MLLLSLDSLIACLAVGLYVARPRERVLVVVAFATSDAAGSLLSGAVPPWLGALALASGAAAFAIASLRRWRDARLFGLAALCGIDNLLAPGLATPFEAGASSALAALLGITAGAAISRELTSRGYALPAAWTSAALASALILLH